LGYQDVEMTLDDLLFDNLIVMKKGVHDLNEVVLTAYKIPLVEQNNIHIIRGLKRVNYKSPPSSIKIAARNWNFYPNPTQDYLKIDVENKMHGTVEVIGNTRKIVATHAINGKSVLINLVNLIDGTYYLRYNLEGEQVENIGKVVKIR
jgi:hypothetical protein